MGQVVDFPVERCNVIGAANSNERAYGLVCRDCQTNVFLITTLDGELTIECAQCRVVVTQGVLAYAFSPNGAA